jgi:dTMP kinase
MASDSYFIVIEGMDGSGKTGITRHLRSVLSQTQGNNVALTFEPHDPSAAGLYIRDALTKRIKATPLALALAFALNRADHNAHVINPFLAGKQPRIIISDRYTLSSLVYQSAGGLTMADVYHLNHWARRPDLTIFLNVSPANCYARMRKRPQDKELFEKNLQQRSKKYQSGIKLLRKKGETVIEVDANPAFPDVLASVLDTVQTHAPNWLKIQPPLFVDDFAPAGGDLPVISDADLNLWVESLTVDVVETLSYADINQLFKAYVVAHGFLWGNQLTWTDTHAYDLSYSLPLGIQQTGIALILDSSQQADRITKTIQELLDRVSDKNDMPNLSDFMIVFDNGRFEPLLRFGREGNSGRKLSPHIQIITRDTLAQWIAKL